jgi:hypothetical protein
MKAVGNPRGEEIRLPEGRLYVGLLGTKELGAHDKVGVLLELNDHVCMRRTVPGPIQIRELVSESLRERRFIRGVNIGGEREISVTMEIAYWGGIAADPEGVGKWSAETPWEAVVQAIRRAIDGLNSTGKTLEERQRDETVQQP